MPYKNQAQETGKRGNVTREKWVVKNRVQGRKKTKQALVL